MCGLLAVLKAIAARLFHFKNLHELFIKVNLHMNVSLDKLCSRCFESVCVCVGVGGRVIVRIDSGITGEPVHFTSQASHFQGADSPNNGETPASIRPVASPQLFSTGASVSPQMHHRRDLHTQLASYTDFNQVCKW